MYTTKTRYLVFKLMNFNIFCKYLVGLNSIPTTCANKTLGQGCVYRHLSFQQHWEPGTLIVKTL